MADLTEQLDTFTKVENTLIRVAKDYAPDRIEVEIGDSKQPDFKPQFKVMRWDNEVNFSMRAMEDPTATVYIENGIVKYKAKDYEIHQYEKPEVSEDGGFEFEWVLPKKPTSNVLIATIQTKELDFFYQPALTEKEIEEGADRPDNVVGSYAVYHKTRGGLNDSVGKEYKTGKAFHIYRPEAIDAKGNRTWCELNVDVDAGVLSVTVPEKWLASASYPVKVDPTFGYTSVGGSNAPMSSGDDVLAYRYETPADISASTINSMSLYANDASGDSAKFGIWQDDAGGTLVSNSISNAVVLSSTAAWNTATLPNNPSLSNSTTYRLGFITTGYVNAYYYDTGATATISDTTNNYASPENIGSTSLGANRQISIYATYTASGGSAPTPTLMMMGMGS